MFFLTTVAGLEPAAAGTVSAVGAVWNALCNPIAGYISDRVRTRFGRRRPMMVLFSIPMGISMLLLFTAVDFPEPLRPVYYGTMLVLFWTCFTYRAFSYLIPLWESSTHRIMKRERS